eukprot:sb/3470551/
MGSSRDPLSFSTDSIPELEESLYTENGQLRLLSELQAIDDTEKRSRKGSSCGSAHSRDSSASGKNPRTSSGSEQEQPGVSGLDLDNSLNTTVTQQSAGSPAQYTGIMSSLTAMQCLVFISDHIKAVADTAAFETLLQARSRFGGYYFGSDEKEDVITLVGIYCQCDPTTQSVAIWGSGCDQMECNRLMSDTFLLENAVNNLL